MYKTLCVAAILLATIVFTSGNNAVHASAPTMSSPVIVASGSLVNQTGPIAKTEIFTPTQTGLYRLSAYMTLTHKVSVQNTWQFNLSWTDDAGVEESGVVDMFTNQLPPNAWSYSNVFPPAFEAVAGQPISYQVALGKGTGTNGGVYSLYYTIEQLQ
jgi:hypothetical protein